MLRWCVFFRNMQGMYDDHKNLWSPATLTICISSSSQFTIWRQIHSCFPSTVGLLSYKRSLTKKQKCSDVYILLVPISYMTVIFSYFHCSTPSNSRISSAEHFLREFRFSELNRVWIMDISYKRAISPFIGESSFTLDRYGPSKWPENPRNFISANSSRSSYRNDEFPGNLMAISVWRCWWRHLWHASRRVIDEIYIVGWITNRLASCRISTCLTTRIRTIVARSLD